METGQLTSCRWVLACTQDTPVETERKGEEQKEQRVRVPSQLGCTLAWDLILSMTE